MRQSAQKRPLFSPSSFRRPLYKMVSTRICVATYDTPYAVALSVSFFFREPKCGVGDTSANNAGIKYFSRTTRALGPTFGSGAMVLNITIPQTMTIETLVTTGVALSPTQGPRARCAWYPMVGMKRATVVLSAGNNRDELAGCLEMRGVNFSTLYDRPPPEKWLVWRGNICVY